MTPLSGAQQAFWLGRLPTFQLGGVRPHRYLEVDVAGLDLDRLTAAWNTLVARHPALRTVVTRGGGQEILAHPPGYAISTRDLSAGDEAELNAVRDEIMARAADPEQWPLFHVSATTLPSGQTRVHFDLDLVAVDPDSFTVLGDELRRVYRGEHLGEPAVVTVAAGAAADLDLPPAPQPPFVREPQPGERPVFSCVERHIGPTAWEALRAQARLSGVDAATTLAAAFGEALANWCKEQRFSVVLASSYGTGAVGNHLALRPIAIDGDARRSFVDRARDLTSQMTSNGSADGLDLLRELARDGRQLAPPIPVAFLPRLGGEDLSGWALDLGDVVADRLELPQVWLAHEVIERADGLVVRWHWADGLLPDGVAQAVADAHLATVQRLTAGSAAWTETAPEHLPEQQCRVRDDANATTTEIPGTLLHELFWDQAARTPQAPAVFAEERVLTYADVRAGATALADVLIEAGARPNRMVAIVMEKGWEHPVAVMGILESGAAYVPIEPDLPEERFHYLLQHSEVDLAVVQPHLADSLPWPEGVRRVVLTEGMLEGEGALESRKIQGQRDLAYVIYTSGSTGLPKGVMIDHRGALNTVLDINRKWSVGPEDRTLALTPLSFDLSVYDLFGFFAVGGAMVMPDPGTARAPWHWADLCQRHRVTVWNTVPALMEMLVGYTMGRREQLAESLRLVVMSGDWIAVSLPDRIRGLASPQIEVVSLGGATEASIWSVYYRIGEVDPSWPSIPYGKPLANQSIHVLDPALRRRPDWVPGEQYIGGYGVAMGYWRDEEKTRRAFITHPVTGERLYRTGDLGRYFADGNVEFLGREDFQVKIHGYRIELGEIEAALLGHENVTSTVVTAIGSAKGEKRLVAYVTVDAAANEDQDALIAELGHHLASKLPTHMIPAHILVLDTLPLTRNGKIDRKALPMPTSRKAAKAVEQVEPTDAELQILGYWADLGLTEMDVADDPLKYGATSLQFAKIRHRLADAGAAEISLASMFEARSPRALAALLSTSAEHSQE